MTSSSFRASLASDFERFKRALPRDFAAHVRDAYRINLAGRYLGEPLPHPVGKGSGQLSPLLQPTAGGRPARSPPPRPAPPPAQPPPPPAPASRSRTPSAKGRGSSR